MPERTIAIGDIHGCASALQTLLDAIQPGPGDCIIGLGDYIDRGPDSRGVIQQLLELAGKCRFVPIMGNHEEMFLASLDDSETRQGWLFYGGLQTLQSYGDSTDASSIPPEHLAFIESGCDYFEIETHFFAHASYDAEMPLDRQSVFARRWSSLRDHLPGRHVSGKTAIVGHTAQKNGEILNLGYLKCIDTWCYGGGWLTALDVLTGQVWQADERGLLRVTDIP